MGLPERSDEPQQSDGEPPGRASRRLFLSRALGTTAGLVTVTAAGAVAGGVTSAHAAPGSAKGPTRQEGQRNWRFCTKCFGMFYYGYPTNGVCPAGGAHSMAGYDFDIPYNIGESPNLQANWRFCDRCFGMFFFGYPSGGWCPTGGSHSAAGFNFVLPHDVVETPNAQAYWRFCTKCYGLFFWGYPAKGRCPAGNEHNAAGFNFVIPHW
ncbi:hypothetical protein LE181_04895 [Streptomyces sp. SCA3-4]|uniref:hypothetical protein n=1 Tax=Streptomyces sichuanensis TaxID=2871810 RepID=UPI001CE302A3|nr:hypothetical protein [Streptomyces sichuanensis]MCA6091504.1 hypothetical protein [Streptomyces sichuanensis]